MTRSILDLQVCGVLRGSGRRAGRGCPPVPRGGGGHSGTEWLPTAKRPREAEALNAKI